MTTPGQPFLQTLFAHLVTEARSNSDKAPSERELADHFGVSRGQVREQLAILEAMRVIERRAKSGIYLSGDSAGPDQLALFARSGLQLDPRQIFEAVELRKIHEIQAAELAARRATEENLARLRDILARSDEAIASGEGLQGLDGEFHLEIVRATQNDMFYQLCASFYSTGEQRSSRYFRNPARSEQSHAEHRAIFDALSRRDAGLSRALMNSHLGGAQSYWSEILDGEGDGAGGDA